MRELPISTPKQHTRLAMLVKARVAELDAMTLHLAREKYFVLLLEGFHTTNLFGTGDA